MDLVFFNEEREFCFVENFHKKKFDKKNARKLKKKKILNKTVAYVQVR